MTARVLQTKHKPCDGAETFIPHRISTSFSLLPSPLAVGQSNVTSSGPQTGSRSGVWHSTTKACKTLQMMQLQDHEAPLSLSHQPLQEAKAPHQPMSDTWSQRKINFHGVKPSKQIAACSLSIALPILTGAVIWGCPRRGLGTWLTSLPNYECQELFCQQSRVLGNVSLETFCNYERCATCRK